MKNFPSILFSLILSTILWGEYHTCEEVLYKGPGHMIITAPSMQWSDRIPADPWILPEGTERLTTVCISLSDAFDDHSVFEYISRKPVIHLSPEYTVATHSPTFNEQPAFNNDWKGIPGT